MALHGCAPSSMQPPVRPGVQQGRSGSFKAGRMQPKEGDYSTEGLPKAFLHSLRTLFDILDDGRRGFVHISEIESRWRGADDPTQDLPGGVLGSLRRVAPPHGCLTFERFVAGLRYSMLNPENSSTAAHNYKYHFKAQAAPVHPQQNPQKPYYPKPHLQPSRTDPKARPPLGPTRPPLGPSNAANTQHRASSLQSRAGPEDGGAYPACGTARFTAGGFERSGRSLERVTGGPVQQQTAHQQQSRVRAIDSLALESPQHQPSRPGAAEAGLPRSQSESATGFRRHGRSREEQRRHTITNGVDYGMLKQMKELEQEKDSLLAGLELVEQARDWYQARIHSVTERQRQVGQSGPCTAGTDLFSEGSRGHIDVLIPKLQEVNRCLNDLISCPGTNPFPPGVQTTSQPLGTQAPPPQAAPPPAAPQAPPPQASPPQAGPQAPPPQAPPPQAIQRLKDQNRLLTQEVTEKSERITQLEQEKSALIKQLFEARARSVHDTSAMDSTFI
ncbi:hypothetical protein NHX12_027725 [Muraenolepis orangiensis]|uniref:Suppressor APC domain-containing protein n=1 Tax=Muraenolepis orangiensis TaxID=630683 RepID=A0A9Q0IPI3_9TELE|nr:hypothetical protein NHX12_027725 [Muraenolepis orangiensis]